MKIEMATTKQATLIHVDEDYIDMELTSSPNFSYSITSSPPKSREFEFQTNEKDSTVPSLADDLFYKGKLLPLHLPPRIQMVQNLLVEKNTSNATLDDSDLKIPSYTPLESCNISTSESYRVSSEVNPDEFSFVWSSNMMNAGFVGNGDLEVPKKYWPKKLKQMKQFLLGQRLKASKAYLKSLFSKSGCSDASAATNNNMGGGAAEKKNNSFEIFYDHDNDDKHSKLHHQNQISCAVIKREMLEDDFINHRKSFSGVVQRHCTIKASSLSTSSSGSSSNSSSFSFSSAGYYDLQLFKRSISDNYELEGSIEGAIAHCKQSQQQQCSSKTSSTSDDDVDARICSQFAAKIAVCGNKEERASE